VYAWGLVRLTGVKVQLLLPDRETRALDWSQVQSATTRPYVPGTYQRNGAQARSIRLDFAHKINRIFPSGCGGAPQE
jgi:hypothetical protein